MNSTYKDVAVWVSCSAREQITKDTAVSGRKVAFFLFGEGSFLRRLHFISCPRPQLWELICFRLEVMRAWRCSNLNVLEVARRSSEPGLLLLEL